METVHVIFISIHKFTKQYIYKQKPCFLQTNQKKTKEETPFRTSPHVHPIGFEPTTSASVAQHSIQLSYGCIQLLNKYKIFKNQI